MKPTTYTKNSIKGKFLSPVDVGVHKPFEFESTSGDYFCGTSHTIVYKNWVVYPGPLQLVDGNGNELNFAGREVRHWQGMGYWH